MAAQERTSLGRAAAVSEPAASGGAANKLGNNGRLAYDSLTDEVSLRNVRCSPKIQLNEP
jgi:hypothetical protein